MVPAIWRTLINQFVTSHFYYAVFYNTIVQSLKVIITAFGPFNANFCHFRDFIGGVLALQLIQLFTFLFTVKFFYIFVFRNPSGIDEEFWCFFLNIWSLLISCTAEFVHQFLPGRSEIKLYICSGTFDNSLATDKVKKIMYVQLCSPWLYFGILLLL
jgi:hypothetical protein